MESFAEQFAAINDEAARRAESGDDPYDVAFHATAALAEVDVGSDLWLAWVRIEDLFEWTPEVGDEEGARLCGIAVREFTQRWLDLADRQTEIAQARFIAEWGPRWEEIAAEAWPS